MKEMKKMKGMPMDFIESGMYAKINEISNYRYCFWDILHNDVLKDTFNLYTRDLQDDGYNLLSEGIKEFYPNNCDNDYINKVNEWYYKVESCLCDLRIELMRNYNIKNPYITVREYIESEGNKNE